MFDSIVTVDRPFIQLHIQMYRRWTRGGGGTDWSVGGPFTHL